MERPGPLEQPLGAQPRCDRSGAGTARGAASRLRIGHAAAPNAYPDNAAACYNDTGYDGARGNNASGIGADATYFYTFFHRRGSAYRHGAGLAHTRGQRGCAV